MFSCAILSMLHVTNSLTIGLYWAIKIGYSKNTHVHVRSIDLEICEIEIENLRRKITSCMAQLIAIWNLFPLTSEHLGTVPEDVSKEEEKSWRVVMDRLRNHVEGPLLGRNRSEQDHVTRTFHHYTSYQTNIIKVK